MEASGMIPGYKMPLEDQLKQAQERANTYAEVYEIALGHVRQRDNQILNLIEALKLVARAPDGDGYVIPKNMNIIQDVLEKAKGAA